MDTTERLHFHFSLSCIGEGNGNPLVFLPGKSQGWGSLVGGRPWGRQSRTRLKRLSSSMPSPCSPSSILQFRVLYTSNLDFLSLPFSFQKARPSHKTICSWLRVCVCICRLEACPGQGRRNSGIYTPTPGLPSLSLL